MQAEILHEPEDVQHLLVPMGLLIENGVDSLGYEALDIESPGRDFQTVLEARHIAANC